MQRTIGLIYETVADPMVWREVVRDISRQVGAPAAWMFQPERAGPTYLALDDIAETVVQAYTDYYHTVDVLVHEGARREPELRGRVLRERDIVDEATWLGSEGYNDFCAPNGIGQILTAPLARMQQQRLPPILSFFRPPNAALFPDQSVKVLQRLLPHLRRAVRLRTTIAGQLAAVPGWVMALLEQVPFGIFLLDRNGRVLHANAVGRITGGELLIPRPSGAAWLMSACPLSLASTGLFGEGACRAWVCVTDPTANRPDLARRLGALFGLTLAEQRIAVALLQGLSPAEVAEGHAVSLPTVRTQIQSIFGKLGVRRQSEMVRVIAGAAALPIDAPPIINPDHVRRTRPGHS
ncbi:MAG: helix-turn-helix transcriptional regulator [Pseudomonadota bacterium]|nr:helix-turn-helix transcriptional regulator [Pseudomonadota bacterium]